MHPLTLLYEIPADTRHSGPGDRHQADFGVDGDLIAVVNQARDVAICEAIAHRHVGQCRTLRQDGIDVVEQNRLRCDAARFHFVQHPGRGDTTLGGVEYHDAVDVTLPCELVLWPRENAGDAVEVVTRRKVVIGDQGLPETTGPTPT